MRGFFGVLVALAVIVGFAVPASAGSNDCGKGPPSWWNSPRVSYTYSNGSSRSYSRSPSYSSRSYSTRSYSTRSSSHSRSYTYSRSYSSGRYAHSGSSIHWR